MREYSKVGPKFWIGSTGKELRKAGTEAQIVAMYLLTSPHANMLGLYYCPIMFIAHETGSGLEGAMKGLQSAIEAGFCEYDTESEMVWVMEMASYQIADALQAKDLRVKGVGNEYASLPDNPFLSRFYDKYAQAFCMEIRRETRRVIKAPTKPLVSQEQEQEQKQEKEQKQKQEQNRCDGASPPPASRQEVAVVKTPKQPAPTTSIWEAYALAYQSRYHAEPVRNAKINGQLAQLLTRLGAEEAPQVAAWFIAHNNRWYVQQGHSVDCLLRDCEKLRTEWVTGRRVTASAAQEADRLQDTGDMWGRIMNEHESQGR